MQSTGVYWIALYDVLEALHTYGLLRDSFHAPDKIRALRSLWRLRDRHVKDAGRMVQHMQKAVTAMNVQLSNAISDISAIVNGEQPVDAGGPT